MTMDSTHTGDSFEGRYAAIDIGTVTCRMLIADVYSDGLGARKVAVVDKQYAVTNLGEGVDGTGFISKDALARVKGVIERYLGIIRALPADESVDKVVAVSTSAARDAENSDEFISMLESLGIDLRIISGEEEAALSFAGASLDFPGQDLAVVDVGGGSTEISIGKGRSKPSLSRSFNIGCRRVTEKFWDGYPPTPEALVNAVSWIQSQLGPWIEANMETGPACKMVAVAGTATSAVTMRDGIHPYDSSLVDGAEVTFDDIDRLIDGLSRMSLAETEGIVGLDPARAPVILAGMLILREVMQAFGVGSFVASESDILDAMVLCAAEEGEGQALPS